MLSIAIFLWHSDVDAEKYSWGEHFSWQENYAGSSSEIQSPRPVSMMPTRERSATVSLIFLFIYLKNIILLLVFSFQRNTSIL